MCKAIDTTEAFLADETETYECWECSCELTSTNGIENDSGYFCHPCHAKRFAVCGPCGLETEREDIAEGLCPECRDKRHEAIRMAVEDALDEFKSGELLAALQIAGLMK